MKRWFPVLLAALLAAQSLRANGLLIPADSSLPPLALVSHDVKVKLDEQVATTDVTQIFRNHTDRALEATYIFPVPAGASVNRFVMWVDGKEVKGEMLEADKAKQIYTDIVRRTQDPGLLEYIGQNLLRVRVFPVPPKGDQKLALRFTTVCNCESQLIEYVYPLKTDEKAAQTLEKFSLDATIVSQRKIHNVYSPTHPITVNPKGDRETHISFEAKKAVLDRDLKLYYSLGKGDVGLTTMTYRPDGAKDGSFLMMISPRAELAKSQHVARDVVFVLDVSGSMAGKKMEQAKKAVKHCLSSLHENDRFAVLAFATTVSKQSEEVVEASKANIDSAKKWVDDLEPTGGTAIDSALAEALAMKDTMSRGEASIPVPEGLLPLTVVFFTDGQPTVGEQNADLIAKNVEKKKTPSTRVFTFGVGDDVNAALLDRLADMTRSASAYVRPEEDIETKVSGLYGKISHPVMTDLQISVSAGVKLTEMYPRQLPDLFHGGQVIVAGRYQGKGETALRLKGKVDGETKELVYDVSFPAKTSEDKAFVENLWARRKVGYLLDQIRANGQQKELVDEVVKLAKKHGITTPYTSYLVVPDTVATNTPVPVPGSATWGSIKSSAGSSVRGVVPSSSPPPPPLQWAVPGVPGTDNVDWIGYYKNHGYQITGPASSTGSGGGRIDYAPVIVTTRDAATLGRSVTITPSAIPEKTPVETTAAPAPVSLPQAGKEGVDLALMLKTLSEAKSGECKTCQVAGRTCCDLGGVWIDQDCKPGTKQLVVKAQSEAYFKLLAKHPELKDVFRLGNRLLWVTPSGTALVIDPAHGSEKLTDSEIDALFKKGK